MAGEVAVATAAVDAVLESGDSGVAAPYAAVAMIDRSLRCAQPREDGQEKFELVAVAVTLTVVAAAASLIAVVSHAASVVGAAAAGVDVALHCTVDARSVQSALAFAAVATNVPLHAHQK